MKVTFPQAKELKNIMPAIVSFLSEGTFKANKDGIFLSSLAGKLIKKRINLY